MGGGEGGGRGGGGGEGGEGRGVQGCLFFLLFSAHQASAFF